MPPEWCPGLCQVEGDSWLHHWGQSHASTSRWLSVLYLRLGLHCACQSWWISSSNFFSDAAIFVDSPRRIEPLYGIPAESQCWHLLTVDCIKCHPDSVCQWQDSKAPKSTYYSKSWLVSYDVGCQRNRQRDHRSRVFRQVRHRDLRRWPTPQDHRCRDENLWFHCPTYPPCWWIKSGLSHADSRMATPLDSPWQWVIQGNRFAKREPLREQYKDDRINQHRHWRLYASLPNQSDWRRPEILNDNVLSKRPRYQSLPSQLYSW